MHRLRFLLYCFLVGTTVAIAWKFPFLFELPLLAAIGGAWLFFFRDPGEPD